MKPSIGFKEINRVKGIGKRKFVMLFVKLYNKLCKDCKRKVTNNPRMDVKDYCKDCQTLIEKEVSKLQ